jgi:hypothetical protein
MNCDIIVSKSPRRGEGAAGRRGRRGSMAKIDLKKELKHLYKPSGKEVVLVDVPPMNFLVIEGQGDPNTSPEYQSAIEALYSVAYALKFIVKRSESVDYGVMPLEGLWWTDDMKEFSTANKDLWKWLAMIMQPEYVTRALYEEALPEVQRKKNLPLLSKMRFETFREGLSVQIMHIGPYSEEGPTIERMHAFARDRGYELRGRHHEIYLSDPRRTAPEKMRTVLRQPVQ